MTPVRVKNIDDCTLLPYTIDVDEYVPLRFRLREPSFGSAYLRLGNYSTSLAEIMVNRATRLLQGVTLTSFESYGLWPIIKETTIVQGLPILTGPWDVPERDLPTLEFKSTDLSVDFVVSLRKNELLIFWSDLSTVSSSSVFESVQCYMKESELCAIRFFDLTDKQVSNLNTYGKLGK